MTYRQPLSILGLFRWRGQFEPRVHVLAGWTLGAETTQVVHTEHSSHMPMAAVRPVSTEASIVPANILNTRAIL